MSLADEKPPQTTRRRVAAPSAASRYEASRTPIKTAAPPLGAPSAEKSTSPDGPVERGGKIAKWVERQYRKIGKMIEVVDPVCGSSIVLSAHASGLAWERIARNNRAIRDILDKLMTTTDTTELLMAHLPIFMAVAVHHVPAFRELMQKSSMAFLKEFATIPDIPEEPKAEAA